MNDQIYIVVGFDGCDHYIERCFYDVKKAEEYAEYCENNSEGGFYFSVVHQEIYK